MRFGVCTGISQASIIADAGADYIELSVAGDLIPDDSDEVWDSKRALIEAMPVPAEAFNSFVRTGKIVGPEADWARLERYAHTAATRAAQIGGKIIVFGSGGARQIPDGYPTKKADADLLRFLGFCADAYEKTGVIVVIEPLSYRECNVLNTVDEGADMTRRVNRPGVRCLADTYHMEANGEALSSIYDAADVLAHTHTADTGRGAPGTGVYDHVALFKTLNDARFDARISIECSWKDLPSEVSPALVSLRESVLATLPI